MDQRGGVDPYPWEGAGEGGIPELGLYMFAVKTQKGHTLPQKPFQD